MSAAFGYVTAPDGNEAHRIARALLDERLIACANIVDGMRSIYRWEGEVREDREVLMILKTRHDLTAQVTQKIREMHRYTCPCVVWWPVAAGNPDYLRWIAEVTASGPDVVA